MNFKCTGVAFKKDNLLIVKGNPTSDAIRFAVDLMSGEDCVLHFNVRFDSDNVIFNTKTNGHWGEEFVCPNPYYKGGSFETSIKHNGATFEIWFPGDQIESIPNRLNTEVIPSITITELNVTHFILDQGSSAPALPKYVLY